MKKHLFYDKAIIRRKEHEYIESLLEKYQNETVDDDLKKKVWDELQMEKYNGNITIPFKLAVRRDPAGNFPDKLEVILDTKV